MKWRREAQARPEAAGGEEDVGEVVGERQKKLQKVVS